MFDPGIVFDILCIIMVSVVWFLLVIMIIPLFPFSFVIATTNSTSGLTRLTLTSWTDFVDISTSTRTTT